MNFPCFILALMLAKPLVMRLFPRMKLSSSKWYSSSKTCWMSTAAFLLLMTLIDSWKVLTESVKRQASARELTVSWFGCKKISVIMQQCSQRSKLYTGKWDETKLKPFRPRYAQVITNYIYVFPDELTSGMHTNSIRERIVQFPGNWNTTALPPQEIKLNKWMRNWDTLNWGKTK